MCTHTWCDVEINYAQISNKNVLEHFINKTSGKTNTKKKKIRENRERGKMGIKFGMMGRKC